VLSSHRLQDIAGFCDLYLFLLPHRVTLLRAHEIAGAGSVTPAQLTEVFDRLRGGSLALRSVVSCRRPMGRSYPYGRAA
jgi:hypothetical protein